MPVLAACLADSTSFIAQRTSHEDRNIQHAGRWPLATCDYLSQKYGAAKELAFCFYLIIIHLNFTVVGLMDRVYVCVHVHARTCVQLCVPGSEENLCKFVLSHTVGSRD